MPAPIQNQQELQFKGYAVEDTENWEKFKLIDFQPKPMGEHDVDIKIEFCGVCGSDVHTITGGWGKVNLPVIVGHEIVGRVARVGGAVTEFKVGDRVAVGAQVCSCGECNLCKTNNEQYCRELVFTYNDNFRGCGTATQGGYSTAIRTPDRFVFPIPDGIKLEDAAPLMCGGLTVYSPLVRNGAGPGKKVGVVGIGGLGHMAIQFAKALGCDEIVAFSHSNSKEKDAMTLGATKFVATREEGFQKPLLSSLDFIICTADVASGVAFKELLETLVPMGKFVMVAQPDDKLPSLERIAFGYAFFGGSLLGSKKEALEMLQLATDKGVKPWIEVMPMSDVSKAVRGLKDGKPRYRYVLKQDIDQ
ncbi:hypothetical protein D9613_008842 [Agrocybe pediades]|uniref:Enoyl reductase (ER) domain-containing protein n=1 Tax=Agrocybe pediades TaxID=84607 RepID=A0A8H4VMQ3_9AGAR|nr:hypothetical protein D9613_008842 [Agrocybe pediades]